MPDEVAELLVSIRADLSDLKAKFEEGKAESKSFAEGMKDSFHEIGKDIAEVFAAEKIKEFFLEGVKDFAEFDKQLTLTQFNLERLGQATNDSKEKMETWSNEIQETTLYTKNEALTTLNKLVVMTGNLGDALKLSKLAMDVSAASGIGLEQTTLALGNAFEGNTSGLGRFTRQFPELKKVLLEGGDAVAFLQEKFDGMSEKIGQAGLAGQLFHLQVAWKEVTEDFAKDNKGAISDATEGFKTMAHWASELLTIFMKVSQTVGVVFGSIASDVIAFKDLLTGHGKEAKGEFEAIQKAASENLHEIWTKTEEESKKFRKSQTEGALHSHAEIKESAEKIVASVSDMLTKITLKQTMTFAQASKEFIQGEVHLKKAIGETDAAFEKRVKDMEAQHKAAAEYIKKTGEDLSKSIEKTSQSASSAMTKAYLDGTLTVAKGFEILGKSIIKSLVEAVGKALEQESVSNFIKATAMLANPLTAAGAPGFYATAGIEAAGAGTIMGVAEAALANGGYVNAPTLALIGEDGPEKVTPLSKGHPMDKGGGDKHVYNMSFPNVRQAKDFTNRDVATVSRKLFTTQQDMKTRSGNRNTSF